MLSFFAVYCASGRIRTFVDHRSIGLQPIAFDHSATDAFKIAHVERREILIHSRTYGKEEKAAQENKMTLV